MSAAPKFFPTPADFRAWLEKNHAKEDELFVGFYKVATGKPSITWDEAVDEALCFGWIDGVRKRIDDESYQMRFSPRRPNSNWSKKNIASAERLIQESRMRPPGLKAYQARREDKSSVYSFEQDKIQDFSAELKQRFQANKKAWAHFKAQPPGYRKTMRHWVMSAKQEKTRLRRLDRIIEVSARGKRVDLLSPFTEKGVR